MLNTILIVGLGGFLGAVLRMLSLEFIHKIFPHSAFFGTALVNVLGSFLMGVVFFYVQNKGLSPLLKNFIAPGFLASFTTFSTFSYENLLFLQDQSYLALFLNILLNVGLGLFAVGLGFFLFK